MGGLCAGPFHIGMLTLKFRFLNVGLPLRPSTLSPGIRIQFGDFWGCWRFTVLFGLNNSNSSSPPFLSQSLRRISHVMNLNINQLRASLIEVVVEEAHGVIASVFIWEYNC